MDKRLRNNAGKAVLWPTEPSLANSIIEDANADSVTGLSPRGYPPLDSPDKLLKDEGATSIYKMKGVSRSELPDLAENSHQN